jgi:hypothetical protein
MFGPRASRQNFLVLTSRALKVTYADGTQRRWQSLFTEVPEGLLAIPANWSEGWNNDFAIRPDDFVPRAVAIRDAARLNAKSLLDPFDDGTPERWSLVFRVGGWDESESFLFRHNDDVGLNIKTTLSLVRPTKAEIAEYGNLLAEDAARL